MPLSDKQQKQLDLVCTRIAEGMSLRKACEHKETPDWRNILRWLDVEENEAARQQYARARETQAESNIDSMMHIAETEEDVNRAKLKIDTIKWTASKLKPKKYGDVKDHNVTGALTVEVIQTFAKSAPDNS